jgi:hypothetical protein
MGRTSLQLSVSQCPSYVAKFIGRKARCTVIATVAVAALMALTSPSANAADADCKVTWDHGLVCTVTIFGKTITVTTYAKASDEQKQRVLRTVEAWKKLPDNQQSLNYVTREAKKIKREIKDISVTRKTDTASPSLATTFRKQNSPSRSKASLVGSRLNGGSGVNSLAGKNSTVLDTRSSAGTTLRKPDTSLKR